jgi:drug/metabolite transporter (DMT)-like permease
MVSALRRRPRIVAAAMLLLASAIWGSTFIVVKQAIAHTPVLDFLAWRFLLAGALLVAVRPHALVRLGRRGWRHGVLLGAVLAAGYMTQTFGLRSTPAAVSGFLTGLQVVFTPLIAWMVLRHQAGRRTWSAVAVATAGLAVLTLRGAPFGIGEGLTVISAALFALQIVGLEAWASADSAYGLAAVQLITIGVVSLIAAAPRGVDVPRSPAAWGAVVLTAVAATAFAFVVQTWAQSHLSATSAAVVFTTEPVFAALFAWISGEPLGWALLAGGALVILAMLVMGVGRAEEPTGSSPPEAMLSPEATLSPGEMSSAAMSPAAMSSAVRGPTGEARSGPMLLASLWADHDLDRDRGTEDPGGAALDPGPVAV